MRIALIFGTILIIVMIIAYVVHLNITIKNQGITLKIFHEFAEREGFNIKEAMSPAQRWTAAAKYRDAPYGLMPSFRQRTEKHPTKEIATNERGDRSMAYLRGGITDAPIVTTKTAAAIIGGSQITGLEQRRSGAAVTSDISFDDRHDVVDLSGLPAQTQQITSGKGTLDRTSPAFMESTTGGGAPSGGSSERFRQRRSQK